LLSALYLIRERISLSTHLTGYSFRNFCFQVGLPDPVFCPRNCGRRYQGVFRRGNLNKHLTYECGGQKKFACDVCSHRFSSKCWLKTHCAVVHKLFVWRNKIAFWILLLFFFFLRYKWQHPGSGTYRRQICDWLRFKYSSIRGRVHVFGVDNTLMVKKYKRHLCISNRPIESLDE